MPSFIIAIAAVSVLILTSIYYLFKTLINFEPGSKKMKKDMQEMRKAISQKAESLLEWEETEGLELLSLEEQEFQQVKINAGKVLEGHLKSIYHEPLVAYSYKEYVASKKNAILYIRTSKDEFMYHIKDKEVLVAINDKRIGAIKANGVFYSERSGKPLARINRNQHELLSPIMIGQKDMGSFVNSTKTERVSPRAFELLSPMKMEEQKLFMAIGLYELASHAIGKTKK